MLPGVVRKPLCGLLALVMIPRFYPTLSLSSLLVVERELHGPISDVDQKLTTHKPWKARHMCIGFGVRLRELEY